MPNVTVHRLVEQARGPVLEHFRILSSEDRRLRFGSSIGDAVLVRYVNKIDFVRDAVFGIYGDDLALSGIAHVAPANESAEFGVSVLEGHRRRGYGTALFARAATWARNRAVKILYMHCLSENAVMMHVAVKAGMHVVVGRGEADARLALPPATADTVTEEWMQDGVAVLDHALKAYGAASRRFLLGP